MVRRIRVGSRFNALCSLVLHDSVPAVPLQKHVAGVVSAVTMWDISFGERRGGGYGFDAYQKVPDPCVLVLHLMVAAMTCCCLGEQTVLTSC